MFNGMAAAEILHSGMLNVVRRVLFTSTTALPNGGAFDFDSFFQFGTGIVLISHGTVYVLTPSHVIRNATENKYSNNSPFWVSTRHDQPKEVLDFLMPMRMYDLSPGGETALDAFFVEMNPMIIGLGEYLDWDNDALFCSHDESIQGATAIVLGYPEEVNEYGFLDRPDGTTQQVANIKQDGFQGQVYEDADGCWFTNFSHRIGYVYPGLSGSVVVCMVNGQLKYLGMVLSIGDDGQRFKILKFSDIRKAAGKLARLPWEVLDEAYFLGHPTHSMMNYTEFSELFAGRNNFVRRRSNDFLDQLLRTISSSRQQHWLMDHEKVHQEIASRIRYELMQALKAVSELKAKSFEAKH